MDAVEIRDGWDGQIVRIQDRDEAHDNGRHGKNVEESVEEFLVDLAAATVRAVGKHGWYGIRSKK